VPWCTGCDRFLSPSTVTAEGTCPTCGRAVDPGRAHAPGAEPVESAERRARRARRRVAQGGAAPAADEETLPVPWHLKVLAGAVALYLGYRAYEGIVWLVHRW